jgi:hypothetical protein
VQQHISATEIIRKEDDSVHYSVAVLHTAALFLIVFQNEDFQFLSLSENLHV